MRWSTDRLIEKPACRFTQQLPIVELPIEMARAELQMMWHKCKGTDPAHKLLRKLLIAITIVDKVIGGFITEVEVRSQIAVGWVEFRKPSIPTVNNHNPLFA